MASSANLSGGLRLEIYGKEAALRDHTLSPSTPQTPEAPRTPAAEVPPTPIEILLPDTSDPSIPKAQWRRLFAFTTKKHAPMLVLALFLTVVGGLIVPAMSILLGEIFGTFAAAGSGDMPRDEFLSLISQYAQYLVALGFAGWLVNGAFFAVWLYFGELQAMAVRERLFEGLMYEELSWYENRKNGLAPLLSKCQTQIRELQISVSQPLGYSLQGVITAVSSLVVAFYNSWKLTFVILAGVPIALGVVGFLSSKIPPHIDRQKEHIERGCKSASRAITCIETVKVLNGQKQEKKTFAQHIQEAAVSYRKQALTNAWQSAIIRFLMLSMFVQGFWYGSYLAKEQGEEHSPASIMTTFWSCLMATQSLEVLMPQLLLLEKGRAAGAGLRRLVEKFKGSKDRSYHRGGKLPPTCAGDVILKEVSFSYPSRPRELVLKNVSMHIPAGETTFIIGRSGSGKSTIGNLIMNAYSPSFGEISIDGHSVSRLDPRWIREHVSYVEPKSVLFDETIFRNITFGRLFYEGVTRAEVEDACAMAGMEQMLRDLPMGLETVVGLGGRSLSGGQLQRVALARDRLRDATVLILDESLSAIDRRTRSQVLTRIREWRRGKTTVIITHDISDIEDEDYVFIMEKGRIMEEGYRDDLDESSGVMLDSTNVASSIRSHRKTASRSSIIPEMDGDFWSRKRTSSLSGSVRLARRTSVSTLSNASPRPPPKSKRRSIFSYPAADITDPSATVPGIPGRKKRLSRHLHQLPVPAARTRTTTAADASPARDPEPLRRPPPQPPLHPTSPPVALRRIFATIWPALTARVRVLVVLGFACALVHAAATPVFSFALAQLLTAVLDSRSESSAAAKRWSLTILGIAFADAASTFGMHFLLEAAGQAWVDRLRVRALARVLARPRGWFDGEKNSAGRIVEDLDKNAEEMRNMLGRFAGYSVVGVAMTVIGVVWSFTASWRLTFVGLAIAPAMYGISRGLAWASDRWEGRCNEAAQATGAVLGEAVTSIRTVRNFVLERHFRQKYFALIHAGLRLGVKRSLTEGVGFGLSDSAILFANALIFWYGAYLIVNHGERLEDVLSVFTLLLFSLSSANTIIALIPQLSNSKDSARRILRLSTLSRSSHETTGEGHLESPAGRVVFSSVTFAYPSLPAHPVLNTLSLTIPAGSFIAVTGSSGSGKSTLASLLLRLYPPSSGMITLDGTPITSLSVTALRRYIAIVPQTPVLFPGTIYENIAYGCTPEPSIPTVYEAARQAGCHEFIMDLEMGYATQLGDQGGGLSTGQAQRVAIARALVRKPRVLVLDEATSGLDASSARVIQEMAVACAQKGVTVMTVTHRVEMMRTAERVVVLRGGQIVDDGSWEEVREGEEMRRVLGEGREGE